MPPDPFSVPPFPHQSVNNFDWSTNFFTIYKQVGSTITTQTIQSPFWENTSGLATEPNLDHFRNVFFNNGFYTDPAQAIGSVDIWPEDGWELLYKDFGTATAGYTSNPSFGLYNRYTGILRIFYYVENLGNTASSTARISLEPNFSLNNNALLSFTETEINALDAFERHLTRALNYAQALNSFWIFAEFPIAFDPCLCRYPSSSMIDFTFEIIKQGTIVLEGKATGFSTPMLYNNGVYTPVKSNIISNHGRMKTASDYLAEVNGYYTSLNKFKDNVNTMIGYQNNAGADKAKQQADIDKFGDWVTIAKNTPKIGAVIGIIDFLVTGGKAKNSSTREPTPYSYKTELEIKLTGSITEDINLSALSLRTPGANNISSPNPIYNNPLGIFNLLESPPVEYAVYHNNPASGIVEIKEDPNAGLSYGIVPFSSPTIHYKDPLFDQFKIREYKLQKSSLYSRLVNFIINPISGLSPKKIKAALVFKFTNMPDEIDTGNYYKHIVGPVEFGVTNTEREALGFVHRMRMCGYEIESWPEGSAKLKDITFRTNYADLACLEDEANFFTWDFVGMPYPDEPNVWLKLDIQLERTDDYAVNNPSQTQDVLMVLKYNANVTENNATNLNFTANLFVDSLNNRYGYEILPNGNFQPNSSSWAAYHFDPANMWNGTYWGILKEHIMSPSPWQPDPINKRYGTLIVDNSNAAFFNPPHFPRTINVYNLYINSSTIAAPGFITHHTINVGNNVYAASNWHMVNTNVNWQQNTIFAYIAGGISPIAYFGSEYLPVTYTSIDDLFGIIAVIDPNSEVYLNPFEMIPFIGGFTGTVFNDGTIILLDGGGIGNINIYGYKNCYNPPQDFQATQANVNSFCAGSTYQSLAQAKADFMDTAANSQLELIKENITIFPNPNNGTFAVKFGVSGEKNVTMAIRGYVG